MAPGEKMRWSPVGEGGQSDSIQKKDRRGAWIGGWGAVYLPIAPQITHAVKRT